jgi:hypothetical protein
MGGDFASAPLELPPACSVLANGRVVLRLRVNWHRLLWVVSENGGGGGGKWELSVLFVGT